jgi:hypothetical protein
MRAKSGFVATTGAPNLVKCPSCGYENTDDALSCNLCRAVLKAKPTKPSPTAATIRVDPKLAAEAESLEESTPILTQPPVSHHDDTRPRHYLRPVGTAPIELEIGKAFTFGRSDQNTLVIPSGRVSRNHAEIRWDGVRAILADKGSANGTCVGRKPIKEHELRSGDEIEIGPFFCTYLIDRTEPLPTPHGLPKAAQTTSSGGDLMTGRIEATTIAELLQSIELNQKTGTLDVFGLEGTGRFQARDGLPLAAEIGDKQDAEAVIAMLGVTSGRFTFMPEVTEERRIKQTITGLLLEFGRRADESKLAQGQGS